jgi:hypothetical protein
VQLFVASCKQCAMYHRGSAPKQGRLQPIILGYPGQRWCQDLCGHSPSSDGFVYIFSAIDPFSKYAVACPIRNKEAATIAKVFVESVLEHWDLP